MNRIHVSFVFCRECKFEVLCCSFGHIQAFRFWSKLKGAGDISSAGKTAIYKQGKTVLVNCEIFEKYLEGFKAE